MSLVVTDDSVASLRPDAAESEADGMIINMFRPSLADFPEIDEESAGRDIIQFRHFRIQQYQSQLQAITTKWSACTVFRRDGEGQWMARPERDIRPQERQDLDALERALNSRRGTSEQSSNPSQSPEPDSYASGKRIKRRSMQTIAQIESQTFFDLIAQVQQHILSSQSNCEALLLEDYSTPEPLMVSFWDNFAEEARGLKEGDLVVIKGLHAQMASDGRMMASMHGDPEARFGNKIKSVPAGSPLAAELLRRKERAMEGHQAARQVEDLKPEQIARPQPPAEPVPAPTAIHKSPKKRKQQPVPADLKNPTSITPKGIPVTTIAQVLAHPERNFKFLIKGRVIGHSPSNIQAFCRPKCTQCNRTWATVPIGACKCGAQWEEKHCWVFHLTITDGTGRIDTIIAFEDGIEFLAGLQPCDLRGNPDVQQRVEYIMDTLQASEEAAFFISSYEVGGVRKYRVQKTHITF